VPVLNYSVVSNWTTQQDYNRAVVQVRLSVSLKKALTTWRRIDDQRDLELHNLAASSLSLVRIACLDGRHTTDRSLSARSASHNLEMWVEIQFGLNSKSPAAEAVAVVVLESLSCYLITSCVKFRTEAPAAFASWACGASIDSEAHSRPPFN
jgi:hypothetical protein